jgi:hypothetical protein
MEGLVELVFAGVAPEKVGGLMADIFRDAKDVGFAEAELPVLLPAVLNETEKRLATYKPPLTISLLAQGVSIGGVVLRKPIVRVIRYNNKIDVEIVFDVRDVYGRVDSLSKAAGALAQTHLVDSCFCGYEPAKDLETRLFTGSRLGPIAV